MKRGRAALAAGLLSVVCLAPGAARAAGELSLAGGIGVPGGSVPVTVRLDGFGDAAVAADVGVQFSPALLRADSASCALDPRLAATHGLGGRVINSTLFVSVFARGLPPLPPLGDGAVAVCQFSIAPDAPPGQTSLHPVSAAVADGNGEDLDVVTSDGRVLILSGLAGDANCDASVDAADLESMVGAVFSSSRTCPTSDVNGDGRLGAADLTAEISLLSGVLSGFEKSATRWRARVSAAAPVQLTVGSVKLDPNREGTVDVTLDSAGHTVAGVLNDIALPYAAAIPARAVRTSLTAAVDADDLDIDVADASELPDFGVAIVGAERVAYGSKQGNSLVVAQRGSDGTAAIAHLAGALVELPADVPDCSASAELALAGKSAVFSYLPAGCTPGVDCATVRAAILALDDVAKIPDGIALYRCRTVAGASEGAFPLGCPLAEAASVPAAGGALPAACAAGRIAVGDSGLTIGRASGSPGQIVEVGVDLDAGPSAVGSLDVDVVFDPGRLSAGEVPCRKAARLSAHRLTQGVIAAGRIRLVIFGLDDPVPPIASGNVATCALRIADDAVVGTETALTAERVEIADPEGQVICDAECVLADGGVSVVAAPTATPTATPRPTATPVPCSGDCNGDHRVAIDELVLGIDIGQGLRPLDDCRSFDASGDGAVDVAEIVAAVQGSLGPCKP